MAIWNTTTLSQLKPVKDFISEHYQLDRELVEKKLKTISSHKLGYYFMEDTLNILPSNLNQDYRVYDLTNTLSSFLEGGINPTLEKVASNKKVAKTNDFIISRLRHYLKEMAIVAESEFKTALSTEYLVFRKKRNVSNEVLLAFSLTEYVQTILLWGQTGNEHPRFPSNTFKDIYLPDILVNNSEYFEATIQDAIKLRQQSQTLYKQATDLLEQELGLDKISFENPKSYRANFSEVVTLFRNDADYYQTKYRQLETHIKSISTKSLGTICALSKGFEVGTSSYTTKGPLFIRVSNLTIHGFKFGNSDKNISEQTYTSLKTYQPKIGDILLTKDGTIGTCYVVDESVTGIISSGIVNLGLLDGTIPKEYLALVINSKICQMQAERECSGALITHWKPEQIRKLRIPILDKDTMNEITDLVTKSKAARNKSQKLLSDAKARVEQLIESAANKN